MSEKKDQNDGEEKDRDVLPRLIQIHRYLYSFSCNTRQKPGAGPG